MAAKRDRHAPSYPSNGSAPSLLVTALAFGGAAAGLGGAAITLGFLGSFSEGAIAGRGYIAIAVVIIGRWTPFGALLGALLFAAVDSLSLRAQTRLFGWPGEAFSMLPYLVTLVALILRRERRHRAARTRPRRVGVTQRGPTPRCIDWTFCTAVFPISEVVAPRRQRWAISGSLTTSTTSGVPSTPWVFTSVLPTAMKGACKDGTGPVPTHLRNPTNRRSDRRRSRRG